MIISEKYKITFLKNPKTGGTSVHESLDGINLVDLYSKFGARKHAEDVIEVFHNQYYGTTKFRGSLQYYNLQSYVNSGVIPGNIEEYTNYVVIREPTERFISLCRHVRSYVNVISDLFIERFEAVSKEETARFKKYDKISSNDLTRFSPKFIETYKNISLQEIGERLVNTPFNTVNHLDFIRVPQSYYYNDPRVTPLDYANLQGEITALCERHNTLRRYILPKMNVGMRKDSDSISQDLINKIKLIYAEDIEFYEKMTRKS